MELTICGSFTLSCTRISHSRVPKRERRSHFKICRSTEINHRSWGEESEGKTEGWCDSSFHCFLSILFVLLHNAQRESQGEGEKRKANNVKTEKWDRADWCLAFNSRCKLVDIRSQLCLLKISLFMWSDNWTIHKKRQESRKWICKSTSNLFQLLYLLISWSICSHKHACSTANPKVLKKYTTETWQCMLRHLLFCLEKCYILMRSFSRHKLKSIWRLSIQCTTQAKLTLKIYLQQTIGIHLDEQNSESGVYISVGSKNN